MRRELWNWFIVILIFLQSVHGHGRMEEPPARNAAWRYGFDIPANYDDVGLNCGGLSVQKSNGDKCGICGDSYIGPRYHEAGGKYATNIIVRHYSSGALIDIKILLSANHKGFMEFRLCPAIDSNIEVTQECLNRNLLYIEGYGTQYPVNEGTDLIFIRAQLPSGLSCSRCVLQWRYHAGNNWGRHTETAEPCLGCGPQEEFYNCADISITSKDHHFLLSNPTTTTTTQNPLLLFPFNHPVVHSPTIIPSSVFLYPTTTTTTQNPLLLFPFNHPVVHSPTIIPSPIFIYPTTATPMNFIYTFHPSRELLDQVNKTLRCYPTNEALKPLIGIENWCLQLCAINCPPTLCICVKI